MDGLLKYIPTLRKNERSIKKPIEKVRNVATPHLMFINLFVSQRNDFLRDPSAALIIFRYHDRIIVEIIH